MASRGIPNGTLGFQRATRLTLQAAIRASSLQSAPPSCNLSLQAACSLSLTWSSKRPPGRPNGHLQLQTATWSSKWPPGASNGDRLPINHLHGGSPNTDRSIPILKGLGGRGGTPLNPPRYALVCGNGVLGKRPFHNSVQLHCKCKVTVKSVKGTLPSRFSNKRCSRLGKTLTFYENACFTSAQRCRPRRRLRTNPLHRHRIC